MKRRIRRGPRASNGGIPLLRADVARWLGDVLQPGDLVLSGSRNSISRLIRWGTMSPYSHAALALSNDQLIESYDWAGTPAEDDDGVGRLDVNRYVGRCSLLHLALLRPKDLDHAEFERVTEHATHYSPSFPTTTAVMLALAGLGDHPRFTIPGVRPYVEKRLHLLGDGAARVTCAEFVARVYLESGVPLRFQTLRLLVYVELLRSGEAASLRDRFAPRFLDETASAAAEPAGLVAFIAGLPRAVSASAKTPTAPDWADLLMPSDFLRSSNFEVIATRSVHE